MTDARAPQQGDRDAGGAHHDLPRDAARPVQRTRIRDAMNAARMAPVVSDPWAELRGENTASAWGGSRAAEIDENARRDEPRDEPAVASGSARFGSATHRRAVVDLTDPRITADAPYDDRRRSDVGSPGSDRGARTAGSDPMQLQSDRPDTAPSTGSELAPRAHYGLGSTWGSRWAASTQGWVRAEDGTVVWRPIVTTTEQLDLWDVDRYLGVVTAEVAATVERVEDRDLGSVLGRAREMGMRGLVTEAIERGAHGVIGVTLAYTPVGPRLVVTMTGTAVTLREKRR